MKLTDENLQRLEKMKKQISMEREYRNKNIELALLNEENIHNNFGFTNIVFISLILIIVAITLVIIL